MIYQKLAERYGISQQTNLGGEVVKEFLINAGVNLERFTKYRKSANPVVRKAKMKQVGGEVSMPVWQTNDQLRRNIREEIQSGTFVMGNAIIPREYKKYKLDGNGNIHLETFTVSGRHIPLLELRERIYEEHLQQGLIREHSDNYYANFSHDKVVKRLKELNVFDENEELTCDQLKNKLKTFERTRHIMVWADHSSIMNHGHILLMICCIWDPAFHYTSTEMESRTGNKLDVQMLVEKPHVYILGRCADTVVDQLCYIPYRVEDLQQMKLPLQEDPTVVDVMRFFHGDHPAISVEVGQQEGGHYACTGCPLHSALWSDLVACFRSSGLTFQQRLDKVCLVECNARCFFQCIQKPDQHM